MSRTYDLFAADGKRCTAKAAGFVRIGIVQGYLTYEEMPKVAGPVDANEYGQFVTDNARWLALELTAAPGSSCARDAFWGRDAATLLVGGSTPTSHVGGFLQPLAVGAGPLARGTAILVRSVDTVRKAITL